jgi:TRAP-type C4-dicarboxylate transport system substrate-binding protein
MTPLADVMTLPFLPFATADKGSEVIWKLYEKYPSIQKEFSDVQPLLVWASSPYILITTKKQVKTLEDWKGLKIRATGGPPTEQIKALGAVPMLIPMPDVYDAMDKGVIDGASVPFEAVHGFRFYEVAKNYTIVPMSAVYFTLAMNKQKWNSLPKDIQDAIKSVSGLQGSRAMGGGAYDGAEKDVVALIQAGKYTMNRYVVPPDELARWSKVAGEPLWQDWVKKMQAKGKPEAKEILATTLELLKK